MLGPETIFWISRRAPPAFLFIKWAVPRNRTKFMCQVLQETYTLIHDPTMDKRYSIVRVFPRARGVEQLQSAFFVERMKDVYGKMAKVAGKVEATCECCSEGKAVAFCRQCTDFICAECVTQHRKMKPFAGNKVTTLDDLKEGGTETVPLKETPLPKCEEHDEQMKIFCLDCNRPVCRDCTVIDHNGHNYNFLKKYATEARKTLRDSVAPLQNLHSNITSANKKVAGWH